MTGHLRPRAVLPPGGAGRELVAFAEGVRADGGRAYVADEAAIDLLCGRTPARYDLVVVGLDYRKVAAMVARAAGRRSSSRTSFVTTDGIEIAVAGGVRARRAKQDQAALLPRIALAEALAGRWFRVEMVLVDPITGEVEDAFGGLEDLEDGRLAIADEVKPTPATVLRGAVLAARYGLAYDAVAATALGRLDSSDVPTHLVWAALEQILLDSARPSLGLEALAQSGGLARLMPELAALRGLPEDPLLHPEGDAWVHTRLVANEARVAGAALERRARVELSVAALCHDIGKPASVALIGDTLRHPNHDRRGAQSTAAMLARLGAEAHLDRDSVARICALVRHHMLPARLYAAGRAVTARFARRLASAVDCDLLYRLAVADGLGRAEPARSQAAGSFFRAALAGARSSAGDTAPLVSAADAVTFGARPGAQSDAVAQKIREMELDGSVLDPVGAHRAARRLVDERHGATSSMRPTRRVRLSTAD